MVVGFEIFFFVAECVVVVTSATIAYSEIKRNNHHKK
jgi:hypothetical protein